MFILDVPYAEKDAAKALGARWHGEKKVWFVPDRYDTTPFARWFPAPKPNIELYVDLVPRTAWFSNLRSELTSAEWTACKRIVFARAKMRCEVCGGRGQDHPVECHERWEYDEEAGLQRLVGLVSLCPDCHETSHIGAARKRGRFAQARRHLMAVNRWDEVQADNHIEDAFQTWLRRSEQQWILDATWLLDAGIELSEETRTKIINHAQQLHHRDIEDWQQEVRERDAFLKVRA